MDSKFGDRPQRTRTVNNADHHDKGLGSEIGYADERASRDLRRKSLFHRQARVDGKRDRNRVYVNNELQRIMAGLEQPRTATNMAVRLFKQYHEAGDLCGLDLDTVTAATAYLTCRLNRVAVTPADVVSLSRDVVRSQMLRETRKIERELGIPTPPPQPELHVGRICSDLKLGDEVRKDAEDAIRALSDEEVSGRAPSGLAAGAIYAVTEHVTQREISNVADVSEVTIRTAYQAMSP